MAFKSKSFLQLLVIVFLWALPISLPALTPPLPAHPSQYVVDLAGVLDGGTQAMLNSMLKDLEAKTTAQVVVLTVNSLEGEPIEDFSHQTAVKWGIGQKGKDNGVLLTVVVQDHKYRIEVGYGLEATLPDSLVGSLGRQCLVPNFRKGDFAAGILAAVTEISNTIARGAGGETAPGKGFGSQGQLIIILLVLIGIILIFIVLTEPRTTGVKKGSKHGGGSWFGGSGGGWSYGGGGFSGGGGDSDSGGGGFSGGGGDFGGGGASGDW